MNPAAAPVTAKPATKTADDAAAPILLREDQGGIAILTLNRPQARNSLSEAMLKALGEALSAIAGERRVRAVVLAANGPAFCAGHDLKELSARRSDADRGRVYFKRIMHLCSTVMQQIVALRSRSSLPFTRLQPQQVVSWSQAAISLLPLKAPNSQRLAWISGCFVRRRWWRCRAMFPASTQWKCCSPAN